MGAGHGPSIPTGTEPTRGLQAGVLVGRRLRQLPALHLQHPADAPLFDFSSSALGSAHEARRPKLSLQSSSALRV